MRLSDNIGLFDTCFRSADSYKNVVYLVAFEIVSNSDFWCYRNSKIRVWAKEHPQSIFCYSAAIILSEHFQMPMKEVFFDIAYTTDEIMKTKWYLPGGIYEKPSDRYGCLPIFGDSIDNHEDYKRMYDTLVEHGNRYVFVGYIKGLNRDERELVRDVRRLEQHYIEYIKNTAL